MLSWPYYLVEFSRIQAFSPSFLVVKCLSRNTGGARGDQSPLWDKRIASLGQEHQHTNGQEGVRGNSGDGIKNT